MDVLSISSETHSNQIIQTFGELLKDNILTAVMLVWHNQIRINAHKIILSAGSPLFRDLLLTNPRSQPLLHLRGLKEEVLVPILQFL